MSIYSRSETSYCQSILNAGVSPYSSNKFERLGNSLVKEGESCKAIFAYSKSAFDMFDEIIDGGNDSMDYSRNTFILSQKCDLLKTTIIDLYNIESDLVILPPECKEMPEVNPGRYNYARSELTDYYNFLTNDLGCKAPHEICGESLDAFSFSIS